MRHLTIHGIEHFASVRSHFGSLAAGEWTPPDSVNRRPEIDDTLSAIIVASVPEEGDPHPRRARLRYAVADGYGLTYAGVETPSGVRIYLRAASGSRDEGEISIEFGRNSGELAGQILGSIPADTPVAVDRWLWWHTAGEALARHEACCAWAQAFADEYGGYVRGDEVLVPAPRELAVHSVVPVG